MKLVGDVCNSIEWEKLHDFSWYMCWEEIYILHNAVLSKSIIKVYLLIVKTILCIFSRICVLLDYVFWKHTAITGHSLHRC
jgi:hypothetical protein